MQNKYLLYLDMLGFKHLVRTNSPLIKKIFDVFNTLEVHEDNVTFKTIVFSDTILIYNDYDPKIATDHLHIVRSLIDFARSLLYRFIGKGLYFRGSLSFGPFRHDELENIDCIYGTALIEAHEGEKEMEATGLLLHRSALEHNDTYPVEKINENYSFVFLNACFLDGLFEKFGHYRDGGFPIENADLFENPEWSWPIAHDIVMLKNIHGEMTGHSDPAVRKKFLATWQMYHRHYPDFLQALEDNNFSFDTVCPGYDWSEAVKRVEED